MSDDFSLVMPFAVVHSKGGPFDDAAYVAGFEAGQLYEALSHISIIAPGINMKLAVPIHSANSEQIDLIAMHHGLVAKFDDLGNGWSSLTLIDGKTSWPTEDRYQ